MGCVEKHHESRGEQVPGIRDKCMKIPLHNKEDMAGEQTQEKTAGDEIKEVKMPQVQSVRLAASTPEQEEEAPEGLDKTNTSESIFRLTPMLCRKLTHRCAKGRSSEKSESYYTDPVRG